jgi:hypothetical protein
MVGGMYYNPGVQSAWICRCAAASCLRDVSKAFKGGIANFVLPEFLAGNFSLQVCDITTGTLLWALKGEVCENEKNFETGSCFVWSVVYFLRI